MSANDIRELENLNPITDEEGGNAYLVNGNMIPISLAGLGVLMGLAVETEEPQESETEESQEKTQEGSEANGRSKRKRKADAGQSV